MGVESWDWLWERRRVRVSGANAEEQKMEEHVTRIVNEALC